MRAVRTVQCTIFDSFAEHEIGQQLKAISEWLDEHRELAVWVSADLQRKGVNETGREGLPAESVLRCALLKQHRQLSYEELAFHLLDSASFQAFARLPGGVAAEEISIAPNHQRDRRDHLGADQSHAAQQREGRENRAR